MRSDCADVPQQCDYHKYPVNGENEGSLGTGNNEWASLSKAEFDEYWYSHEDAVLKVVTGAPVHRTYYIQRTSTAAFSPFHAIRDVRQWGDASSDYRICEPDPPPATSCFDEATFSVTHDGGAMEDEPLYTFAPISGLPSHTVTVTKHGITGNHKTDCEWLYSFEEGCQNTATSCYGPCGTKGNRTVVTKLYIGSARGSFSPFEGTRDPRQLVLRPPTLSSTTCLDYLSLRTPPRRRPLAAPPLPPSQRWAGRLAGRPRTLSPLAGMPLGKVPTVRTSASVRLSVAPRCSPAGG